MLPSAVTRSERHVVAIRLPGPSRRIRVEPIQPPEPRRPAPARPARERSPAKPKRAPARV